MTYTSKIAQWTSTRDNLSSGFMNRLGSNQSAQLQRLVRIVGFFAWSKFD